jgi:hypothetical protein
MESIGHGIILPGFGHQRKGDIPEIPPLGIGSAGCCEQRSMARGQGASVQKASAHWISDFELRI